MEHEDRDGITYGYTIVDENDSTLPQNSMYHSNRWGETTYTIKELDNMKHYKVVLHFAEIWFGVNGRSTDDRFFNIFINNAKVKKNFNIFREAGRSSKKAVTINEIVQPQGNQIKIELKNKRRR